MNCPCKMCNGMFDDMNAFFASSPQETNTQEETPTSVYDRLAALSKKLHAAGVQGLLISELNEITEEVDRIDSEITELQRARETQQEALIKLGEISKRLF